MPPIPGMMPGMPPAMMGGGMGGPPGMPAGMPPGPDPAMQALESLQGVPSPKREEKAMAEASAQIQLALTGVYTRSAKAAKHLSNAYKEIQSAREALNQLANEGVGAPPNLLGGLAPLSQGPPSPML